MTRTLKSSLLYKYCKANSFSYQLLNGELYFSQPRQLNDPTDLNPGKSLKLLYEERTEYLKDQIKRIKLFLAEQGYDIDNMSFYQQINEEVYELRHELKELADGDEPGEFLMEWAEEEMDKIKQRILQHRRQGAARDYPKKFEELDECMSELWNLEQTWWGEALEDNLLRVSTEEIGVLCLTTDNKNYRMWTMYADGFRGICIGMDQKLLTEFLTSVEEMKIEGPIPVIYRKITLKDLLNPRFANRAATRYKYKNPNWSSEKEVRFVSLDDFGTVQVPLSFIKEIIVGNLLDPEFRQKIALALRLRNDKLTTECDTLHVYEATGDSLGRVHIQIDAELDRLINRQENLHNHAQKYMRKLSDAIKEYVRKESEDDDSNDIPF